MKFLTSAIIAVLLGLAISINNRQEEIRKDNINSDNDIIRTEWVKTAKEVQPLNNVINGVNDGSK